MEEAPGANNSMVEADDNDTFLAGSSKSNSYDRSPTKVKDGGVKPGFLPRLRSDLVFRKRLIHTFWLCWSFITLGWLVGQMGPSFPDLQLIVQEELDTASWLFTTFSIGYLLGSLFGGILYDRYNKLLLIALSVLGMAVTTGALPWCSMFPLMLTVRLLTGVFAGGLDTGSNADMVSLWDEEEGRPCMQALHFCFGFGGIISPLVTQPFLAKKQCVPVSTTASSNDTLFLNTSLRNPTYNDTSFLSHTISLMSTTVPYIEQSNVSIVTEATHPCQEEFGETRVHISYTISAVLILTAAVPFLLTYWMTRHDKDSHVSRADQSTRSRPDSVPIVLKCVLLFLLSALMLMYCAVEDTYAGFLMTFCLTKLNWTKSTGSFATSLYWTAFSVGRFSGIFLVWWFKPANLLATFCIFLMTSLLGLLLSSMTQAIPLVWVFIPLAGFSMSVIFPSIFTWTDESILPVTGKISALFLISASSGLMLNPLFLGYLMDHISPNWFLYLLLAQSILCFLLYLTARLLVKFCLPGGKGKESPEQIQEAQPLQNINSNAVSSSAEPTTTVT